MRVNLIVFSLISFLLFLQALPAKAQQIIFNKVLPPAGKTFEHVTGIVQDKLGYMWFSTKRGLYRYDGYQMISYKNNPVDPNSLASDALETITTDTSGIIWIGTSSSGLDRLDPATGIFTHFRHNPNNAGSLNGDAIAALLVDKDNVLWVGTGRGMDRFDAGNGTFKHFSNQPNDSTSLSSNQVRAIYEDRQGTLWIGTGSVYSDDGDTTEEGGLNRLDKKTGKFIRYLYDPRNPQSIINNKVRALFEDSKGNFWVGTAGDGLHTMDRAKGAFHRYRYDPAHPEKLSRPPMHRLFGKFDHITFIREDVSGAIWIGTSESGLNYYNPKTQKITHYEYGKDTTGSFTGRSAWWSYTSRDGIVWISTLYGDLYRINALQRTFPFQQSAYEINAFYEEKDGTFWIGTTKGGLVRNDPRTGAVQRFMHEQGKPSTIGDNTAAVIAEDRRGNLWIGTDGGLYAMNKKSGAFVGYRHDPKINNSLSSDIVSVIYEDSKENLWIGTSRGLNRMERKTGLFNRYIFFSKDSSVFGSNTVSSVYEDRQGLLWVGCVLGGGVQLLNPASGKFRTYMKGTHIIQFYEDAEGTLWAGGNDLYKYSRTADTFYRFTDPAAPAEITYMRSLLADDQGNLWIGSPDGILKVNPRRIETTLYGRNHGVNGNDLIRGACYKGRNGKLYFGLANGYYAFFPDELTKNIKPPEIIISGFRLSNRLVIPGENSPLRFPLSQTKQLTLNHNQNVFYFDFAAIDYTNPEDNRQLFMLENYDNDWRKAGSEQSASYFNVPPGKYVFRVKGANRYGIWAEKSIEVIISPPWWRTWWAYTLFAVLLACSIWAFTAYRSRKLKSHNKMLEEKVKQRTNALTQSLEELKTTQTQLVQREKMASLGEVTAGIAHEIQNPLNFINNFSDVNKELIDEMKNEFNAGNKDEAFSIADNIKENELKINEHGKRADSIVKGMLQHSRVSTSDKELTNINALADEYLRLSYHGLRAKDKSFNANLQTQFDDSIGKVLIVPQDVGRVLLNLYNNAFYSVNEKKKQLNKTFEPTVEVSTKKAGNKVEIFVRDNGVGISQKILDKIYQPFFTTKPTGQGTGLGLSLSYDIIKAHGGEIKVNTKEGEGAEFTLVLSIN